MSDAAPPSLWDRRSTVESALDDADGLLLCSDFDGTLAAIERDPDAPALPGDTAASLETIADHPRTEVAVVSGRALDDLTDRVALDDAHYVGNHGLERRHDGDRVVHDAAPDRGTVRHLCETLSERLDVDGCTVEDKGLTATVHYRVAPEDATERVRETVESVLAAVDGFERRDGKQIHELHPVADVDKGVAVAALAARHPDDWLVAYLGDDDTDEDAFRTLDASDLAVHVGTRTDTAASLGLAGPADVSSFLDWLATDGLARLER